MISEIKTPALKIAVAETDRQRVIELLQQNNLPVSDIDADKLLYLFFENGNAVGTAGLEIYGDCGLLRSVSVAREAQGKGFGKLIVTKPEAFVKESGINCLYLLTTTAADFFTKQGYSIIKREDAPGAIQQTTEFSSLCPSSAIVMTKRI